MDFPIEYRDRMLAEQMVMMDALQFIARLLIYFFLLLAFVFLIVNLSGVVWVRLGARRQSEHCSRGSAQHGGAALQSRLDKIE